MDTYVLADSLQKTSGTSNSYVYTLTRTLKGVFKAELISSVFQKQTSCTHVLVDILELRSPRNVNNCFGIIATDTEPTANVMFTTNSHYSQCTQFDNPFDLDRLTVNWLAPNGNGVAVGENTILIKFSHIK